MNPHVLVIEDDPKTASLLQLYLENAAYTVTVAHDGERGLHLAQSATPDLVLLDLMLPQLDGLTLCRLLRKETRVPLIMLTARSTEEDVLLGLETGADDYIVKPFSPREVVARVRTVLRRATDAPPKAAFTRHDLVIDPERHDVRRDGQPIPLTPKEFQILVTLARHPGQVLSRGALAMAAFGHGYEGLERTVDTHIFNLRRKLETTPSEPRYILTVFGVGYRFAEDT